MKMRLQNKNSTNYSSYNDLVVENGYSISFGNNKQKNLVTANTKIAYYDMVFSLSKRHNKYITESTISIKGKKLRKLIWNW